MHEKKAACQPVEVDLEPGKAYFWCACGHSKKQPFCDGIHKEVNFSLTAALAAEKYKPVRLYSETPDKIWLCLCKLTKNPPYCDGTHNAE
ncbi:MAG: CDGSH iron-sulfur domain-containing protein [Spirochaetes bacterium]|nr:CDGSH iron-sulfur domain-containing protein [Spirochaetota bacterium]